MKNMVANSRLAVGDTVSWVAKSGNGYTGTVVNVKEGFMDDLIIVDVGNGKYRSFYDRATEWI
jgi:plastocyanin